MNEKPDFRTRLIADLFEENWNDGPAAAAYRLAAACARRRRSQERLLLMAGTAATMALAVLLSVAHPGARSDRRSAAAPAPAYQVISDDELLAEVHDRPLLALREPSGARRILVLEDENP